MTESASGPFRREICRDFDALTPEWDDLADRTRASPYLRPGWIRAWGAAFASAPLDIVTVRRDGRLVGVVPAECHVGVVRSPTNWHTPVFDLLAEDEGAALELARALFALRPAEVKIAFLEAGGPGIVGLHLAADEAHFRPLTRVYARSPYLDIHGEWAAYERQLSKNLRADVARRRRRLAEAGKLEVEVADGTEDLETLLDEGFSVEGSGWKGRQGTAIASQASTKSFYTEVARWAADRGSLRLAFLRQNRQPIAFLYDLEEQGSHYYIKGGYDPAYARFSPAKLLLYCMVERAFLLGLERFEFLGGEDEYKLQFANSSRTLLLFQAFRRTLSGVLRYSAYSFGAPLVRTARSTLGR